MKAQVISAHDAYFPRAAVTRERPYTRYEPLTFADFARLRNKIANGFAQSEDLLTNKITRNVSH